MLRVKYCDSTSVMLPQWNTVDNHLRRKRFYFVKNLEVPVKDQVLSLFGPPMRKHNVASAVEQKQSPAKPRSYRRTEDKSGSPDLIMSATQATWVPRPYLLKVPPPSNIKHMDLCGHYPHPTLTSSILFSVTVQPENHSSRSAWVMITNKTWKEVWRERLRFSDQWCSSS